MKKIILIVLSCIVSLTHAAPAWQNALKRLPNALLTAVVLSLTINEPKKYKKRSDTLNEWQKLYTTKNAAPNTNDYDNFLKSKQHKSLMKWLKHEFRHKTTDFPPHNAQKCNDYVEKNFDACRSANKSNAAFGMVFYPSLTALFAYLTYNPTSNWWVRKMPGTLLFLVGMGTKLRLVGLFFGYCTYIA